jgi:hypothetical protein
MPQNDFREGTMKPHRRQFLHLAAGAAAFPAVSRIATAQTYPTRPIRLVVPSPPGGVLDFIARPLAQRLKPVLGSVFIENVSGGAGSLGSARVAHARPDGYTILLAATSPICHRGAAQESAAVRSHQGLGTDFGRGSWRHGHRRPSSRAGPNPQGIRGGDVARWTPVVNAIGLKID